MIGSKISLGVWRLRHFLGLYIKGHNSLVLSRYNTLLINIMSPLTPESEMPLSLLRRLHLFLRRKNCAFFDLVPQVGKCEMFAFEIPEERVWND